jgi:nucleotide-binding universal stress UspA family protein
VYKKILIPTDGSSFSIAAAQAGVELARQLGAEVAGIHVAPEYQFPIYAEVIPPDYPTQEGHTAEMRRAGAIYLAEIEKAATGAGLKYSGTTVISDRTAQQIVAAADEQHCDLIFMGSHGRSGWQRLLLGSVTAKVLAISQIPVLVYRPKQDAAPA